MTEFKLFQDQAGEYRWHLRAGNAEKIAASSEGYTAKDDAVNGIRLVKADDLAYEVYEDKAGQWRWRGVATNARTIATSGEGYKAKADCERGLELVRKNAPDAPINDETLAA